MFIGRPRPIRDQVRGVAGNDRERKFQRQYIALLDDRHRRARRLERDDARAALRGNGAADRAGTNATDSGRRIDDRIDAAQYELRQLRGEVRRRHGLDGEACATPESVW